MVVKQKGHRLTAGIFAALASGLILMFGLPSAYAAVLSVGPVAVCGGQQSPGDEGAAITCLNNNNNYTYGGYVCADVAAGSASSGNLAAAALNPGTPVQAYDCHAGPNQQFEFVGFKIYALGGQTCLAAASTAAGSPVVSTTCGASLNQAWYYYNGQIINLNPFGPLCLDATTLANGMQLVVNPCNGSVGQNWQFK